MEDGPPTTRDHGDLLDAMSGNVPTARSAPSVAGAADTVRSWSFGTRRQRPA